MKKIIVPIDYSLASKNALNYALEIASVWNLSIEVVHVYAGLFNINERFIIRAGMGRESSLLADMDYFINVDKPEEGTLMVLPDIKIERKLLHGMPDIELTKLSKEEDCAMMIMGTTGAHGMAGKLFGSISTEVARHAGCPVVLVPKDATFRPIKQILFASNYESATPESIKNCMAWAKNFKSSIHFVHIAEGDDSRDFEEIKMTIFDTLFEKNDPFVAFEINNIHAYSVGEGLQEYIEEQHIDLLVMVAPKKNFLQDLFHKSRTTEMAFSTKIPMVVYHN